MVHQRYWSWILIISQLAWGSAAFASPTPNQVPARTAESALLTSLIEVRGQNLSREQMQARMDAEIFRYARTANPSGVEQRLEQAFVSLGIYEPGQARDFVTDAEQGARELRSSGLSDSEAQTRATAAELKRLVALYPAGAQFSACTAEKIALFGGFAMFAIPVMANNGHLDSTDQPGYDISIAGGILSLVAFAASLAGACN